MLPIRNEAAFIEENLLRILRQDYPLDRFEIIVADGMSNDGTREILDRIVSETDRVNSDAFTQTASPLMRNRSIVVSVSETVNFYLNTGTARAAVFPWQFATVPQFHAARQ